MSSGVPSRERPWVSSRGSGGDGGTLAKELLHHSQLALDGFAIPAVTLLAIDHKPDVRAFADEPVQPCGIDHVIVLGDDDQRRTCSREQGAKPFILYAVAQPLAGSSRVHAQLVVEVGLCRPLIDVTLGDDESLVQVAHGALTAEGHDSAPYRWNRHHTDLSPVEG